MKGPVQITQTERMEICHEIVKRLHQVFGAKIKAIGVYGSISRGTDGPYSDIEMLCVLREANEHIEYSYEWSAGAWKAEVDIYSEGATLNKATTIEGRWPLTHGPYFSALSFFDPEDFFPMLKKAAESIRSIDFSRAINEVLVGEMYEFVGKLRNVNLNGPYSYLPHLAVQFAQYGAMLIGLHNQKIFSTGAMVLPEALKLPFRPAGFDDVAKLVMSGELSDPLRIVSVCEQFWNGIVEWAAEYGYVIDSERIPF